uniref:Uncharacterized protein n=1 Tax=Plectus sambesii TaxID=2011161 RepID=A0A914W1Q8_9BILA
MDGRRLGGRRPGRYDPFMKCGRAGGRVRANMRRQTTPTPPSRTATGGAGRPAQSNYKCRTDRAIEKAHRLPDDELAHASRRFRPSNRSALPRVIVVPPGTVRVPLKLPISARPDKPIDPRLSTFPLVDPDQQSPHRKPVKTRRLRPQLADPMTVGRDSVGTVRIKRPPLAPPLVAVTGAARQARGALVWSRCCYMSIERRAGKRRRALSRARHLQETQSGDRKAMGGGPVKAPLTVRTAAKPPKKESAAPVTFSTQVRNDVSVAA